MSKTRVIEKLTADLKSSRNGEIYYASKYCHWKEHATGNRVANFLLSESYLTLESYCEGLKKQLLRYQNLIHGDEAYKERASASMVNRVFPAIPMRPQVVPIMYFAAEDLEIVGVKQIIKATYNHPVKIVVSNNVDVSLNDVKGKRLTNCQLSKAYKKYIHRLVQQKKEAKSIVIRQ